MTILYNPQNVLHCISSYRGTVLPLVIQRLDTWIFLVFHVALLLFFQNTQYQDKYGNWVSDWPFLPWASVATPAALLVIFIVFYNANCYSRYNDLYAECCGVSARIMEMCGMLWLHLESEQHVEKWNITRYLLAAMHVHYYGMAGGSINDDEWKVILDKRLLNEDELNEIKKYRGAKFFLLQCWACKIFKKALSETDTEIPTIYNDFEILAFRCRAHCGAIKNALANPVPFPYFHILQIMIIFNYMLLAYAMLVFNTWLSPLVYCVIVICYSGMREISACFADPFGDDDIDFPVDQFLNTAVKTGHELLKTPILKTQMVSM